MIERVNRRDDERLYQPRIHARWIRALYRTSQATGLPMTVLVDEALRAYCLGHELREGARVEPARPVAHPSYRKTYEIIGWAYGADPHCKACTHERFGDDLDQAELADGEGNPIHPLFLGDATLDECCGDCGRPLTG